MGGGARVTVLRELMGAQDVDVTVGVGADGSGTVNVESRPFAFFGIAERGALAAKRGGGEAVNLGGNALPNGGLKRPDAGLGAVPGRHSNKHFVRREVVTNRVLKYALTITME